MCQGLGPKKHDEISEIDRRVDKSDERASSSRPSGEPARGRSITRRDPNDPDDGDDDSDDSDHSSDSDFLEGEPPGEGDDPTGEDDRNPIRININPLRAESQGRAISETRRFRQHETVKVPKIPYSS